MPATGCSQPPNTAGLLLPEMAREPGRVREWRGSTKVRGAISGRGAQMVHPAGRPFVSARKPENATRDSPAQPGAAINTQARIQRMEVTSRSSYPKRGLWQNRGDARNAKTHPFAPADPAGDGRPRRKAA